MTMTKGGWTMRTIKLAFKAMGAFCKWLIKAVFRFM